MTPALRQQLAASGWRILGAVVGLAVLLVVAALWGNHIEHRIDKVAISQHRAIAELRQGAASGSGSGTTQFASAGQPSSTAAPGGNHTGLHTPGGATEVEGGGGRGDNANPGASGDAEGDDTSTGSPAGPGPPAPSTVESTASTTTTTVETERHPLFEAAGATLQEAGETVNDTVNGTKETVESLGKGLGDTLGGGR